LCGSLFPCCLCDDLRPLCLSKISFLLDYREVRGPACLKLLLFRSQKLFLKHAAGLRGFGRLFRRVQTDGFAPNLYARKICTLQLRRTAYVVATQICILQTSVLSNWSS